MKRAALVGLAAVFAGGVVAARPAPNASKRKCRSNSAVVGSCFTVDGKLFASNGNPIFRLHPRGTKRILGIAGDEEPIGPSCLFDVANFLHDVDGTFVVCPFQDARPGHMRSVCVEEVVDARVIELDEKTGRRRTTKRIEGCALEKTSK